MPLTGEPGTGPSQRPWGWFETLARGEGYLVKRLCLYAGRRISLQRHRHRCEHWVVVRGEGTVACGGGNGGWAQETVCSFLWGPCTGLQRRMESWN